MEDMKSPSLSVENLTPDLCFPELENEGTPEQSIQAEESWKELKCEEEYNDGFCKVSSEGDREDSDDSGEISGQHSAQSSRRPMSYPDRVRILNLRRNLNQLDNLAKEKSIIFRKTREELNACHLRIRTLTMQQEDVEKEIEREKEAGNTAAVFRLQATQRRLCGELGNEKDLESKIAEMLNENMLGMWEIEIEQGKFADLRKQIMRDEKELDQQHREQAQGRLQKQMERGVMLNRKCKVAEREQKETSEDYEQKVSKALDDAQRNREKGVQFLKSSLARVREKEAEEEQKRQEDMQRRMETVLSLKNNIASTRESFRTLQAQDKALALEAKEQEQKMKEAIQSQGLNITREFLLHKRQEEFEKQKKEFTEQQKVKKMEIVARILREEAQLEKVKKQSRPWRPKKQGKLPDALKWRRKTWHYIGKACTEPDATVPQKTWRTPSPCSSPEDKNDVPQESSWKATLEMAHESKNEGKEDDSRETLAEPEFTGLWDQECDVSKVSDGRRDSKPLDASKLEKAIFARNLEKLHSGVIHKHRVSGREFKGCPFYSKPSLIHFKDFDVGKTYKKKMILINAFYSINYCKLVGVSEHLKDFFTVHFDPPGPMSAGMSCEVGVTFKPMINEDLEGEVAFLSHIGSFSIPLKCSTKKCVLALDKELIDFGTHVVGETISRTITLTNCGALATRFQLHRSSGLEATYIVTSPPSVERAVSAHMAGNIFIEKPDSTGLAESASEKGNISFLHSEELIQHISLPERSKTDLSVFTSHSGTGSDKVSTMELTEQNTLSSLNASPLDQQPHEELAEITPGKVTEGDIGPFSSVKLHIIFTPAVPGDVRAEFGITFDNPDCDPLRFIAVAVSVAVPVWVPNPDVDLKICMYDRLYQDCIIVQSRASSALRLKFEVCKELANHMELLPKTGYIQSHSSFSVQLKFLPRKSLPEDAGKYFDEQTRVLEVPMTIVVSDQSKPVEFTVHAIVTTSDVEISPTEVDFGYCSIYEAVQTTIMLTNKAILPQEFGFVGLPEFVEIEPNDGFGTLLPLESLSLDIIFKANKAKEYSFELTCKTEINRQFKLLCKAIGVHPPLELSHSLVQFSATALNDVSTATLFVINNHVSLNKFTHAVPRIGKGDIAPVGPTSFQFIIPEDSPITIMPCVGTVQPGKKCLVEVSFRPVLSDQEIRQEAVEMVRRAAEMMMIEKKARDLEMQKRKEEFLAGRKRLGSGSFLQFSRDKCSKQILKVFEVPDPENILPNSEEYIAAHLALIRNFNEKFERYIIPCLVASGAIDEKEEPKNLQDAYSRYNTLYLELHCPSMAPSLLLISNNGRSTIYFGSVAVGHRIMKKIKIQNISQEQLPLAYSLLSPFGPFWFLNPIRTLEEGESRELHISFCPEESRAFCEMLEIRSQKATLAITLIGDGVIPSILCSVEGDMFNLGYVIAKETATSTFKIENTSSIALKFSILLESLSPDRDKEQQKLPTFLTSPGEMDLVVEGTVGVGKIQEFTVTFSPDHESLHYSDCLKIMLFKKEVIRVIQLKGAARNHMMFVEGGDPLDVPVESLALTTSMAEEAAKESLAKPILLRLECIQSETLVIPAVRELRVGGIRTAQFPSKKTVEFSWESLSLLQVKGFTVDPVKGTVDRGQTKAITISWVPPAGLDPDQLVTATAMLTLKGDVKEVYSVYFMSRIVTNWCRAQKISFTPYSRHFQFLNGSDLLVCRSITFNSEEVFDMNLQLYAIRENMQIWEDGCFDTFQLRTRVSR
ncbi:cilia- and flagella-associated protein 74 isoform X2 [Paroedura picta]|uniref:cilia- and flagella-associated protein 74 isoform X2 n=1 Tax=Paroedura picta TaxID=143630 RepID=UPI0040568C42